MKNELFLNKKHWKDFNEQQINEYVDKIFTYYREVGFPYYFIDKDYRNKEFDRLMKYDDSEIIKENVIKQTMHGLALCWSYFPHAYSVKCGNMKTPMEAFNDDSFFKRVIKKRLKMGDNISDSGIRKMLKIFTGVQSVSNFRPTAASSIYKMFSTGKVLDMSAGFGGRLIGSVKAGVEQYTGIEPCEKTYFGLLNIIEDFKCRAEIIKDGSENFIRKDTYDLAFTSPPYFDTEKYDENESQSYKKYPTKEEWIKGYLKKTFENTYDSLKSKARMIINIANVKTFTDLEERTIQTAKEIGFKLENTLNLSLSSINKGGFKFEPVFVFKKEL